MTEEPPIPAWGRVDAALKALASDPALRAIPGIRLFVIQLRQMCEDIGAHASVNPSLEELMSKMEAGFHRARKIMQDESSASAKQWLVKKWALEREDHNGNKTDFVATYLPVLKREFGVDISARTVRERWLKGQ